MPLGKLEGLTATPPKVVDHRLAALVDITKNYIVRHNLTGRCFKVHVIPSHGQNGTEETVYRIVHSNVISMKLQKP